MKCIARKTLLVICGIFSTMAIAGTTTKISDVHLCCSSCQEAVENAVGTVNGAIVKVNRDEKTVILSADDDDVVVAQQALDAIAQAGFYGNSDNATIAIKTATTKGNVAKAKLKGFHNCCGSCSNSIENSLSPIKGVTKVSINKSTCNVEGDFDVLAALKAVNKAGFSSVITK